MKNCMTFTAPFETDLGYMYKAIQPPTTKHKSLSSEINLFKPALKRFILLHLFYSVEEYLDYRYN